MLAPVPKCYNRENLLIASRLLEPLSAFVFGGTLLGLTREGDIIENDDDVDFYVDTAHFDSVISLLKSAGFEINLGTPPNTTPYFVQGVRYIDNIKTYLDIYLYQNDPDKDWIVDLWNFSGTPDKHKTHLFVDKDLIFPLKKQKFFDRDILLPAKPEQICAYIYGEDWKKPASKANRDYIHRIIANRPVFIQKDDYAFTIAAELYAEEHELSALSERLRIAEHDRNSLRVQISAILNDKAEAVKISERRPCDIIMIRFKNDGAMEVISGGFDGEFYNSAHPDVAAANMNPLDHYFEFGRNELREIRLSTFRSDKSGYLGIK